MYNSGQNSSERIILRVFFMQTKGIRKKVIVVTFIFGNIYLCPPGRMTSLSHYLNLTSRPCQCFFIYTLYSASSFFFCSTEIGHTRHLFIFFVAFSARLSYILFYYFVPIFHDHVIMTVNCSLCCV